MNIVQKQLLALISSGLWGTEADAALFEGTTDWKRLYRLAREQAVFGMAFDGLQTLPAGKRPERALYLQWCNTVMQMEDNNRLLNKELANVCALLRKEGIEPVLLKGQGVAQNYRNPLHRQCGDIDLYIGEKNYAKVNELLLKEATCVCEASYKHVGMEWHGVEVENHRIINSLSDPWANRCFQREIAGWHGTDKCRKVQVDDCTVTVPPLTFDVVYIMMHAVLHFLNEGIGLRQVCDWANLLHDRREQVDKQAVRQLLRRTGLTKAARIFGFVAVEYLGLPVEEIPVPYTEADRARAEWLMKEIWHGGNFGHFNKDRSPRPQGYWRGKWHTFARACRRCRELGSLVPAESRWYPLMLAVHSVQAQWRMRVTHK